jgi:MFS transporter, ACS family, hexuronate transporter
VPRLSDRIGRKPVIIGTCVIGFMIPFSLLSWSGSALLLAPLIFVGASVGGAMSLFMGVVPSETVPPRMVATTVALVIGLGEILGGVVGPTLSGMAADRWGLRAPIWITAGCLVVAIAAAFAMDETAPRALAKRGARTARNWLPSPVPEKRALRLHGQIANPRFARRWTHGGASSRVRMGDAPVPCRTPALEDLPYAP